MDPKSSDLMQHVTDAFDDAPAPTFGRKTALVTGSVALGALITGAVYRKLRHNNLRPPDQVPPALDADVHEMEMMEGRVRFYERPGTGVPIVLLHSLNAAASSHEMKPIFDHFAERTQRPVYAMDWLGFGLSDRPPVHYTPGLYQRQLRRFLSEHVHRAADLVALSLGCEYAASVGFTLPYLVQRFVAISPSGLSSANESSFFQRTLVEFANSVGAFEIFFHRLTQRDTIQRFYAREIFLSEADVPEELVDYAYATARVWGAHHAPRFFIEGRLFTRDAARHAYTHLRVPTLFVLPGASGGLIQDFDLLDSVVAENADAVTTLHLPSGLLPQWDRPQPLFEALDRFMNEDATIAA